MADSQPFLTEDSDTFNGYDEFVPPQRLSGRGPELVEPTDRAWAVAFKINMAVTLVSALYYGATGITALEEQDTVGGRRLTDGGSEGGGWLILALTCAAIVGVAWVFSWGLLHVLINCSKQILQVAYLGVSVVWALAAVSAFSTGHLLFAIIPCVVCAYFVQVFVQRQSRIRFGAANLKVAAMAIKSMPWTFRVALLMSGVQVLWVLVSSTAAAGSIAAFETVRGPDGLTHRAIDCRNVALQDTRGYSCQCSGEIISYNSTCEYSGRNFFLVCFWFASLTWGGAVFKNVVAATVTGSVASWWFSPNEARPVQGAFYRATHSSFGSLCKAAAITSAMQLLRAAVRRLSRAGRWVNYLLEWVQVAVDYVLAYTICFIGIYGLNFSQAGSRVGELFRKRGVTTIANDTVVDVGLSLLAFVTTVGYLLVVVLLVVVTSFTFQALSVGAWDFWAVLIPALYGFIACAIVVSTTLEVVRSGFKAVFVCFVQDPEALAAKHDRRLYNDLSRAWEELQLIGDDARSGLEA